MVLFVAVVADEGEENRTEKSEDESLDKSNENLDKVEWEGREEGELRWHEVHKGFECLLTPVDVPEESEGKCDWADQDRDHLKKTDHEEDDDHSDEHSAVEFTLRSEDVTNEALDTVLGNGPVGPADHEDDRHRGGHIKVGICSTHEG